MKNNVEKIMENYKKELEKIEKKYEVKEVKQPKKIDTKEVDEKIKYEKEFIAKLEFEGEASNKDMIEKAKARLELAETDKKEIEEKNQKANEKYERAVARREEKILEKNKLKKSTVKLESGREVTMEEKDRLDRVSLKDNAIKELTQESKSISEELLNKQKELEEKRKEWNDFKYEFDDEHQITNHDIVNKIHADYDKIIEEMKQLNEMQKKCNNYLKELKMPTKENKQFSEAWNSVYKQEIEDNITNPEPVKTEPVKTEPVKTEPVKTEPVKPEPVKTGPINPGPTRRPTGTPLDIPISKDSIKILLDASPGLATIDRRKSGVLTQNSIDLEEIMNSKKEKEIRKNIVGQFKEDDDKEYAIKVNKLKKNINPAILNLLNKYDDGLDIIRDYIDAVEEGNKDKLPFKYDIKLEDVIMTEKPFTILNRYAVRDNKNLGTDFKATQWYTFKKILSQFPTNTKFVQKWIGTLPEPFEEGTPYAKRKRELEIHKTDKKYELAQEEVLKARETLANAKTPEEKEVAQKALIKAKDDVIKYNRGEKSEGASKGSDFKKYLREQAQRPMKFIRGNINNENSKIKNIRMHTDILGTKIKGHLTSENKILTNMKVRNIKQRYTTKSHEVSK